MINLKRVIFQAFETNIENTVTEVKYRFMISLLLWKLLTEKK